MARRRKQKRHQGKRQRPRHSPSNPDAVMSSSDDLHGAWASGRQSSDAASSEQGQIPSEGIQTAMTSVLDTDEDMPDSVEVVEEESGEEQEEDDDADAQSVYFSNQAYLGSIYRSGTGMPNGAGESIADVAASTRSLWAQDLDYREMHGRLYCGEWFMPIDELEQMRMALNHQVISYVLGEHCTVPLHNPTHILDVGTGTGEWAIKMAEQYPDCEVVGTDIAAIAETSSVPMNVFFEIEDAEDWDRLPNYYDLVHMRILEGAFKDWAGIFRNVYTSLKPGGWLELQDFDSTDGMFTFLEQFDSQSPIHKLLHDLAIAKEKSGRRMGNFHKNPRMFLDAGLVDVRTTDYQIPISVAEKSVGKIWLMSCLDALEASCLRPLTEHMGWDPDRCKAACEAAARELIGLSKDPEKSKHLVVKMSVVVGRKPLNASVGSPSQETQTRELSAEREEASAEGPKSPSPAKVTTTVIVPEHDAFAATSSSGIQA